MILSQTTSCALEYGDTRAVKLIAEAGFDAVDYNFSPMLKEGHPLNGGGYREYALQLLSTAKANNVYFNQGHAITHADATDPDEIMKILIETNKKVLEISGILGIKTLIIHPLETGCYIGREAAVFERNMKYYRALLPFAREYGVIIACENMWCKDKKRGVTRGSVCSNPYEHARYIDEINSPFFTACLDVGHCSLSGREAQDCIRILGNRLGALHIHDNDYNDDMHTLPGLSEMNWDEITKALADIDYKGDFTFETNHFFDSFCSEEETKLGLRLAAVIGRKMISKIEQIKQGGQP